MRGPDRETWLPPLFYAKLILLLSFVFLHGLAFWFDYYSIPPLLVVLLFSLRAIARAFTDYLWFDSLHVAQAWEHQIGYQEVR